MKDYRQKEKRYANENTVAQTAAIISMYLSWEQDNVKNPDQIYPRKFIGVLISKVLRVNNIEFTQVHVDAIKILLDDPAEPCVLRKLRENENFDGYVFRDRMNLKYD